MIPYKDDIKSETVAYVTYAIIAANVAIFAYQFINQNAYLHILKQYAAIPHDIVTGNPGSQAISPYFSIITAMFLHGNIQHLAFNMLFLNIFGNNVEDRLGHISYAIFYLAGGYLATLAHAFINHSSTNTVIGASGAVSAILGAYMLLYPKAKIHTFFIVYRIPMPAIIFIGLWAIIQTISGINASLLGKTGVAWFSHLGGFIFGVAAIKIWPSANTNSHRKTAETKKHAIRRVRKTNHGQKK